METIHSKGFESWYTFIRAIGKCFVAILVNVCYSNFIGQAAQPNIIQESIMTNQEIAKALDTTVDKVEAATKGMGEVNPSMLPSIGEKIHGGKLAVAAPVAPLAGAKEKKSSASRRTTKMKDADSALAVQGAAAAIEIKEEVTASTQPQVLESIDQNASALSIGDEIVASLQSEIVSDINQVAQLLNPNLRALKTVQAAQGLSSKISEKMDAEGLTVEAIIAAAIPAQNVRRSVADLFSSAVGSIEVAY